MNEDIEMRDFSLTDEEQDELKNYKKYIKYCREGVIRTGNKN